MTSSPDTSVAATVRALWPAAFPDLKLSAPKLLLSSDEYDTWRVRDVVVKFPKSADDADKLARAVSIREDVAAKIGEVMPSVVAVGNPTAAYPWRAVAFERARGRPGQESDGPMIRPKSWGRTALAKQIADILTKLHSMPVSKAKAAGVRKRTIDLDTGIDVGEGAIAWARKVAGNAVDSFLISPLPETAGKASKGVVCHADLKGEHIFVSEDGTRVTALIDWADMAIADPAVDIGGLVLWLGPSFAHEVAAAYRGPAGDDGTADRAIFLARVGLLHHCEAVLEGRAQGSTAILNPQLAAAFSD